MVIKQLATLTQTIPYWNDDHDTHGKIDSYLSPENRLHLLDLKRMDTGYRAPSDLRSILKACYGRLADSLAYRT